MIKEAFLRCINNSENIISIGIGTLSNNYRGDSSLKKPIQQYFRWNSTDQRLVHENIKDKELWHPLGCKRVAKKDINSNSTTQNDKKYLENSDGYIFWKKRYSRRDPPAQVYWSDPDNGAESLINVKSDEVNLQPIYNAHSRSYILTTGWFSSFSHKMFRGKKANNLPMVIMNAADRKITRKYIPRELTDHLSDLSRIAGARLLNTSAVGDLILVSRNVKYGGGLYLSTDSDVKRIWCATPKNKRDSECELPMDLKLSPDGCKIAFLTNSGKLEKPQYQATVRIINLCVL